MYVLTQRKIFYRSKKTNLARVFVKLQNLKCVYIYILLYIYSLLYVYMYMFVETYTLRLYTVMYFQYENSNIMMEVYVDTSNINLSNDTVQKI